MRTYMIFIRIRIILIYPSSHVSGRSANSPTYINNFKERHHKNHHVLRVSFLSLQNKQANIYPFCQVVIHFISLRSYKQFPPLLHDLRNLTLLTAQSRVFLEKLNASQLAKEFPAIYGNRRFTTSFTTAGHVSLY